MTIHVGDTVRITGELKDLSSVYTDPGALTVEFKDPAGTVSTYVYGTDPEVVRSSTGIYYLDIPVDTFGRWAYRFISTGNGAASTEGDFRVSQSDF